MITSRYAHANNKAMGTDDDIIKPTSWIKGLDGNNVYGWAMSQKVPIGDYSWLPQEELETIKWEDQHDDQHHILIWLCS